MLDCTIVIKLIQIYLPDLYYHFVNIGYELCLNNVLYKWFVSIYIQNLSQELSFIIWDVLLFDGNLVMFKSALAILKIIKNELMSKNCYEDLNQVLDESTRYLNDHKALTYYLVLRRYEFDQEMITKNREALYPNILATIKKNHHQLDNMSDTLTRNSFLKVQ